MQNITAGQPGQTMPLHAQTPSAVANVSPEPVTEAVKPLATEVAKPLISVLPTVGQPAATQTFTHAVEKQTVNLPPLKMDADEAKWAQQLHGARRVGAGPLFVRPAGGRQHNVREPRRLGEEDVLHGEEV